MLQIRQGSLKVSQKLRVHLFKSTEGAEELISQIPSQWAYFSVVYNAKQQILASVLKGTLLVITPAKGISLLSV